MKHVIKDKIVIIYDIWNENILICPDIWVKDLFHFLIDRTNSLSVYKLYGFIVSNFGLLFLNIALNKLSFHSKVQLTYS
jgi:hypothetical protein